MFNVMYSDEQEKSDVRDVLMVSPNLVHVGDPNALDSFNEGRMIFDVRPHAEKLEAFVQKHGLQHVASRGAGGNFPAMNSLVNNRPISITQKV